MKKMMLVGLLVIVSQQLFCQVKIISVAIPPEILRVSDDDELIYFEIKTNEDGIINAVESVNGYGFISPTIIITDDRITIDSEDEIYAINEILLLNNEIRVRGGSRSVYTRNDDYLHITLGDDEDIIYEHDELRMKKLSDKSLVEEFTVNPSRYSGIVYADKVLKVDYRFRNNTMMTFEYRNEVDRTIVAYSDMRDKYSREIGIYGDSLYNQSTTTNVINYFILLSVHSFLAEILSPMIFLEDPF
jgi:hypothetical protein